MLVEVSGRRGVEEVWDLVLYACTYIHTYVSPPLLHN